MILECYDFCQGSLWKAMKTKFPNKYTEIFFSEFRTNLNLLKSQHIRFTFIA